MTTELPSRPLKRARVSGMDSYTKDSSFFFRDGTIFLVVETTVFKIHQSVLERHSTVFRDMFSIPSSADGGDASNQWEGLLVVTLNDLAEDVRALLRLTYDIPPIDAPLAMIGAVLRIAHKYQAEQYEAWCIAWIKKYPSTDDTMAEVYGHPYWPKYDDPREVFRLLKMTELLNKRELDGIAALAYHALCTADWGVHNQGETFDTLHATIFTRLGKGQRRIQSDNIKTINAIFNHDCTKSNGHIDYSCLAGKKSILLKLVHACLWILSVQ
ncbi:hypothetical protein FRB94_003405 [Tulasnella sp. JGI-2019a]|nr:hypothetical protein FRB94_003405 [Tulasnella sp. JGI-2019a]